MDEDQAARRLKLIEALMSLGLAAWMLWTMIPQHNRQILKMRLILAGQKTTARCARLAGALSMGAELASGREPDGAYAVPLGLSHARDWLGRCYDKARNVSA